MKHTQHNDPFEYSSFKDESFWDFSWENDWKTIVGVVAMVAIAFIIYVVASLLS